MRRARLSVVYLLEDTALFGGVKVVLHQAELMARLGHRVTVVSKGGRPAWFPLRAGFLQVQAFAPELLPRADVTVATYWTTIAAAAAVTSGQAVHYCQGFEAALGHNVADHEAIIAAYHTPIPCLAVSDHLAELVREHFPRPVRVVSPALERYWSPTWRARPRRNPRVVVMHPFEFYMKGVPVALEAVRQLRERGLACVLVRVSQWPLSDYERGVLEPDEFHQHLQPHRVAAILRHCDVMLAPSWEQEGFGLPVLEAMACGLPVVASDIPAFRGFALNGAVLVPWDRPDRFAEAANELLTDARAWRGLRRRAIEAARPFAEERVAAIAEDALYWVADGRWRSEP